MATKPLKEIQLPGLKYTYTVDADTVDGKHAADFAEAAHDHATYETKDDATAKLSEAKAYTDATKSELSETIVSESNEWIISDTSGNIVARVDVDGLHITQIFAESVVIDGTEAGPNIQIGNTVLSEAQLNKILRFINTIE